MPANAPEALGGGVICCGNEERKIQNYIYPKNAFQLIAVFSI